jgi:hypothetical protein
LGGNGEVRADDNSVGPNGINALATGLSGNGVGIGQLELGRPGDGFGDGGIFNGDSISFVNTSVVPFRVYNGTGSATTNEPLGTDVGLTTNGSTLYFASFPATGPGPDSFQAISDSRGAIPAGTIIRSVNSMTGDITMSAPATATTPAGMNDTLTYSGIDNHAEGVAGVMISKDQVGTGGSAGVAPTAFLFSNFFTTNQNGAALADQYDIQQAATVGHPIMAMNYSFGSSQGAGYAYGGTALLSEYVDWSARVNNVLYAISGNEGKGGFAIPTDNYNGITVSFTQQDGAGVFDQINAGNNFTEAPANGRNVVGLTAPGTNINLTGINSSYYTASGTSFAAPQVTAGDALVINYDTNQVNMGNASFQDAEQVPVEKAILLNSADKVQGILGMNKTITTTGGQNFLQEQANNVVTSTSPLDPQMGSGQIDVGRAITQAAGGEAHTMGGTAVVNPIGWDLGSSTGDGSQNSYIFKNELPAGSYISATLDWDRMVTLVDPDPMDTTVFHTGDTFNVAGLTDLHLLLETLGPDSDVVAESISDINSTQQIFFQIPETGDYELVVDQVGATAGGGDQQYGLAWWAAPVPEPNSAILLLLGVVPLGIAWKRRRRPVAAGAA